MYENYFSKTSEFEMVHIFTNITKTLYTIKYIRYYYF